MTNMGFLTEPAKRGKNPFSPEVNCSFPTAHAELPLNRRRDKSQLYHGNQHHTIQHAHTHTLGEQLLQHPAVATVSVKRSDQFSQQRNSKPILSIILYSTSSLLIFALLLYTFFFLIMSQKSYLQSAEDRVLRSSVGVALDQVVTEEKGCSAGFPRDARRCS